MDLPTVIFEEDSTAFSSLDDDDARFEYSQYVVNTAPADRPEISEDDAAAALEWMEDYSGEE